MKTWQHFSSSLYSTYVHTETKKSIISLTISNYPSWLYLHEIIEHITLPRKYHLHRLSFLSFFILERSIFETNYNKLLLFQGKYYLLVLFIYYYIFIIDINIKSRYVDNSSKSSVPLSVSISIPRSVPFYKFSTINFGCTLFKTKTPLLFSYHSL